MGIFYAAIFIIATACGLNGHAWAAPAKYSGAGWQGTVTHVSDGDTLWVRPAKIGVKPKPGGQAVNIRIDGIDAPEICQVGGVASRAALIELVLHKKVHVEGKRRDAFGRLLARIKIDEFAGVGAPQVDAGSRMVAGGQAWAHEYKRYKSAYSTEQTQAKAARRGLFADARAEYPRDFRKRHGACPHTPK